MKPDFAMNHRAKAGFLCNATLTDKRYPHDSGRVEFSSLLRGLVLLARAQVPSRRLEPARRALQRHPRALEVEERVVAVETAEELPNLVGNHCAATPFQVLTRNDAC